MDRRYEKIEVGRLYKKSTSEGTQNTIGSKSRLGSEAWGSSTRDRERSAPRLQQTERLALLGTMAATFAHEVGNRCQSTGKLCFELLLSARGTYDESATRNFKLWL
jgi:hypothetical protein